MKGGDKDMKNKVTLSALILSIFTLVAMGATSVSAQTVPDPHSTIIQKIAQKFGLKEEEVKAVFEQEQTERQAKMLAKYEEQLTKHVQEGKITEAQKGLILSKKKELVAARHTNKENLKNMTPEERRTVLDTKRQELTAWAQQNGIDPQYLRGFKGSKRGELH